MCPFQSTMQEQYQQDKSTFYGIPKPETQFLSPPYMSIYKVGDDVRQDQLVVHTIALMDEVGHSLKIADFRFFASPVNKFFVHYFLWANGPTLPRPPFFDLLHFGLPTNVHFPLDNDKL